MINEKIAVYTALPAAIKQKIDEWADNEKRSTSQQIALIVEQAVLAREQTQPAPRERQGPLASKKGAK